MKRILESLISGFIISLILQALDRYGGIFIMTEIWSTFIIGLWPWWIGLAFAVIYWFTLEIISIHKCITKSLNFDKKLDELGAERRNILTHVNNYYNEISNRIDKIEKKLPPASGIE